MPQKCLLKSARKLALRAQSPSENATNSCLNANVAATVMSVCVYAAPKRRRRKRVMTTKDQFGVFPTPRINEFGNTEDGAEMETYGLDGEAGFELVDFSHTQDALPFQYVQPPTSTQQNGLSTNNAFGEPLGIESQHIPWFLRDDTWILRPAAGGDGSGCAATVQLEDFVQVTREMFQQWVHNGHNSFIHKQLYKNGMPTHLQDAFTTLSAYLNATSPTKELTMQIAQDRSLTLCRQAHTLESNFKDVLQMLAHVQALSVHVYILLFDGSVSRRSWAERLLLPTLRQWVIDLLKAARGYRGNDTGVSLQWLLSDFNLEYDANAELWQSWVLTESVRRTHLIVDSVSNVYDIMVRGHATCRGGIMFTARRGLWDAESAAAWSALCSDSTKVPLMVPSLQPEPYMLSHGADEFDKFTAVFWSFLVGAEKIKYWVDIN